MKTERTYFDQCVYDIVKDTLNKNNHQYYRKFLKNLVEFKSDPSKPLEERVFGEANRIKVALRKIANDNQGDSNCKKILRLQARAYADLKRVDKEAKNVISLFYV